MKRIHKHITHRHGNTHTHAHARTHTHTHTVSLDLSLSLFLSRPLSPSLDLSRPLCLSGSRALKAHCARHPRPRSADSVSSPRAIARRRRHVPLRRARAAARPDHVWTQVGANQPRRVDVCGAQRCDSRRRDAHTGAALDRLSLWPQCKQPQPHRHAHMGKDVKRAIQSQQRQGTVSVCLCVFLLCDVFFGHTRTSKRACVHRCNAFALIASGSAEMRVDLTVKTIS